MRKYLIILFILISCVVQAQQIDILHDQTFYTHENVAEDDIVGYIVPNPDSAMMNADGEITKTIITDTSGLWRIDGNYLKCLSTTGLQTKVTYGITIKGTVTSGYYDNATISIYVYDADNIKYIDQGAASDGTGTWAAPRKVIDPTCSTDSQYFYKRGYYYTTAGTITMSDNSGIYSYGTSTMPIIGMRDAGDNGLTISGDDHVKIQGVHLRHHGRCIAVLDSIHCTIIDNCKFGGTEDGDICDMGIFCNNDGATMNYPTITNCIFDTLDSDCIYIVAKYPTVTYNVWKNFSYGNDDGDGCQCTIDCYKAKIWHNYSNKGNFNSVKGTIMLWGDKTSVPYGEKLDTTLGSIKWNWLIEDPDMDEDGQWGIVGGDIGSDTVMFNYLGTTGVGSGYPSQGIRMRNNCLVAYNIIEGWDWGLIEQDKADVLIYNNIIRNCQQGINNYGTTGTSGQTIYIKNNVFQACDTFIYALNEDNPELDYNFFDTDGTDKWVLDGSTYTTFSSYQDPYDIHGYEGNPDWDATYHPTAGGNLVDVGTDLLTQDFIGNTVPDLAYSDIGIYESTWNRSRWLLENDYTDEETFYDLTAYDDPVFKSSTPSPIEGSYYTDFNYGIPSGLSAGMKTARKINLNDGGMTLSFNLYVPNDAIGGYVFFMTDMAVNPTYWSVMTTTDNKVEVWTHNSTGAYDYSESSSALTEDAWNHVTVRMYDIDGAYSTIFINGVKACTDSTGVVDAGLNDTLYIGNQNYRATKWFSYKIGYLDNIHLYSFAASDCMIELLYTNRADGTYYITQGTSCSEIGSPTGKRYFYGAIKKNKVLYYGSAKRKRTVSY
jgi:hypothetical protein